MLDDSALYRAAVAYAKSRGIATRKEWRLGHGTDGTVWKTTRKSALKAIIYQKNYEVERDCYLRLKEHRVAQIAGLAVPALIDHSDEYRVVELEIVDAPYLLDFGKAYLDAPPPYWADKQMRANAFQEWRERFDSRWEEVAGVLASLESYGIYYVDPRPSNINLGEETA